MSLHILLDLFSTKHWQAQEKPKCTNFSRSDAIVIKQCSKYAWDWDQNFRREATIPPILSAAVGIILSSLWVLPCTVSHGSSKQELLAIDKQVKRLSTYKNYIWRANSAQWQSSLIYIHWQNGEEREPLPNWVALSRQRPRGVCLK